MTEVSGSTPTQACPQYHRDSIGGICLACGRPKGEHPVGDGIPTNQKGNGQNELGIR